MTEVPEHLLKKAAEARARLSGEEGDASSADAPAAEAAPASAAPVPAAAAVPAEPEPEPEPIPDTPMVAAAKARKTIPVWVMPVLLFLPIWAIYYVGYLENPPTTGGFAFEGEEVYTANCAGCHGGGGGGGSGRVLNGGEVLLTFPVYESGDAYDGLAGHIGWVANGSAGTEAAEGTNLYGDPDRPGGQRTVGSFGSSMGAFASSLSVEELAASVFHERSQFGGDQIDADAIAEELEVLEEFVHVAEEEGIENLGGLTVAEIHDLLQQARGESGGGNETASE
ncbi:MAG: hypothetical protein R8F63_16125 [Acidimicrobiales bacterium]|nr:hypothetical protein [Acidimicrobiales bacterium]